MQTTGRALASAPLSTAHELRNLLSPLVNALELIRMAAGDNPDVASALLTAERQVDGMRQLADELRDGPPPA